MFSFAFFSRVIYLVFVGFLSLLALSLDNDESVISRLARILAKQLNSLCFVLHV